VKFQDVARYEFRIFGTDLTRFRDAFAALGEGATQPVSHETYIVTRLNIESNVKIRAGRLDVKGLKGRLQLLEQWEPILSAPLPVSADEIENVVAPALGIDLDLDGGPSFGEDELMKLAEDQPALQSLEIDKTRTLYDLGDCEAEFTQLAIGVDRLQTVAVESLAPDALNALIAKVSLASEENISYPAFLQARLF